MPCSNSLRYCTALLVAGFVVLTFSASAQTFSVLHDFTAGLDGIYPYAGLSIDRNGTTLYGTSSEGSADDGGAAYKLTLKNGSWVFVPLYSFGDVNGEGVGPLARPILGPNGSLYGTTSGGPNGCGGCGTVYNLRPSPTIPESLLSPWHEGILYQFMDGSDGASPGNGDLYFDSAGNIYGTTFSGGDLQACGGFGCGTVFKLTPSGGGWTKTTILAFNGNDGATPYSGLTPDAAGNLYGTTVEGGAHQNGTVYQLTPSGGSWTQTILYDFPNSNDGHWPVGGLVSDAAGNLYGATEVGGSAGGGTVYELTNSDGHWTFTVIYSFSGHAGPYSKLAMDAAGNLFGTTYGDGSAGVGTVFKLMRSGSGWTYALLHDFTGGSDGASPLGGVLLDAGGHVYGTAEMGGAHGWGVVYKVAP